MPDDEEELKKFNHPDIIGFNGLKISGAKTRLFEFMEKPKRAKRAKRGIYDAPAVNGQEMVRKWPRKKLQTPHICILSDLTVGSQLKVNTFFTNFLFYWRANHVSKSNLLTKYWVQGVLTKPDIIFDIPSDNISLATLDAVARILQDATQIEIEQPGPNSEPLMLIVHSLVQQYHPIVSIHLGDICINHFFTFCISGSKILQNRQRVTSNKFNRSHKIYAISSLQIKP